MELSKLTENNFNLYKEGEDYILALGAITRKTERETQILVSDVDANTFKLQTTCGCTAATSSKQTDSAVIITVRYKDCDRSFAKTVTLTDKNQNKKLKIKGTCQ
jgi:hypothetical protein